MHAKIDKMKNKDRKSLNNKRKRKVIGNEENSKEKEKVDGCNENKNKTSSDGGKYTGEFKNGKFNGFGI